MKSLEFIYQESEIHFLVNGTDKNVMINATEMAKVFGKKTELFLKSDHAKAFIDVLINPPNGGLIEPLTMDEIMSFRSRNGMYFHRLLALKFAAWLDPHFEIWVYRMIETLVFGNYKKHWDAHSRQEMAKIKMAKLREQLLTLPNTELAREYFLAERDYKEAKNEKSNAIRNQLRLFDSGPPDDY